MTAAPTTGELQKLAELTFAVLKTSAFVHGKRQAYALFDEILRQVPTAAVGTLLSALLFSAAQLTADLDEAGGPGTADRALSDAQARWLASESDGAE
jgi:hypothetical protein